MLEINSAKYIKPLNILVDGMQWEVRLPGAADELALSQASRRIKLLDRKVESGEATEDDLNLYDSLESRMMSVFAHMFKDQTADNSEVKAWIDRTPVAVIQLAIEDIKRQTEAKQQPESDGGQELPTTEA